LSVQEALRLGAREYRQKPCAARELVAVVRRLAALVPDGGPVSLAAEELTSKIDRLLHQLATNPFRAKSAFLVVLFGMLARSDAPTLLFYACATSLRQIMALTDGERPARMYAELLRVLEELRVQAAGPVFGGRREPGRDTLDVLFRLETTRSGETLPKLRDLAEALDVHESTLSHRVRDETGLCLSDWRKLVRLRRTVEAVLQGEEQIGQIAQLAYSCERGFAIEFNRDFRWLLGTTPTKLRDFRREILGSAKLV
jgi:AraC-like DNA-binding protein